MSIHPTPPATFGAQLDELRASLREEAGRTPVLAPLLLLIAECLRRLVALWDTMATPGAPSRTPTAYPAPRPTRRTAAARRDRTPSARRPARPTRAPAAQAPMRGPDTRAGETRCAPLHPCAEARHASRGAHPKCAHGIQCRSRAPPAKNRPARAPRTHALIITI